MSSGFTNQQQAVVTLTRELTLRQDWCWWVNPNPFFQESFNLHSNVDQFLKGLGLLRMKLLDGSHILCGWVLLSFEHSFSLVHTHSQSNVRMIVTSIPQSSIIRETVVHECWTIDERMRESPSMSGSWTIRFTPWKGWWTNPWHPSPVPPSSSLSIEFLPLTTSSNSISNEGEGRRMNEIVRVSLTYSFISWTHTLVHSQSRKWMNDSHYHSLSWISRVVIHKGEHTGEEWKCSRNDFVTAGAPTLRPSTAVSRM